jgi:hypothetical protein
VTPALIVNADDWGRDAETTRCILDCMLCGSVTSTSAMVFMEGSEEGAALAREHGVDTGLHLNFTTPFTAPGVPEALLEQQKTLGRYLRRHRLAQIVFNPLLSGTFAAVVTAQIDEYRRLYGADPLRIDGHHHMHLCANVLLGGLLPPGIVVRRNFSFQPGEKGSVNRWYRKVVDSILGRQHRLTDFLFSLPPMGVPGRLERIASLAGTSIVELETHPVDETEYRFLRDGGVAREQPRISVSPFATVFNLGLAAGRGRA